MRTMSLPRTETIMQIGGFISIIIGVVLFILAIINWFDHIDEFDRQVGQCAEHGGQLVKIQGQTRYKCVKISPIEGQ